MNTFYKTLASSILPVAILATASTNSFAGDRKNGPNLCDYLPSHSELESALRQVAPGGGNGGLEFNMWGTIVARDGTVCAVARTSEYPGDQWPGSRVISAQKANTANAFSLPGLALSTANLFSAVQPGGSLFGLQESNPVDTKVAYRGNWTKAGTKRDPMVGGRIGGVNVFGGGLALYDEYGNLLGGLGVSGDTSCADHNVAWRTRHLLGLDYVPGGVAPTGDDDIVFDITADPNGGTGVSAGGWGHASCGADSLTGNTFFPVSKPHGSNL